MPGELLVIATPIGNLGDLSPRAREALAEVDVLLCEDTRQTAKLLAALGIDKPMSRLERLDAHADGKRLDYWTGRLLSGNRIGLVSDAGTPSISDPGSQLVERAHEAGVKVTPIPGPSALAALLSVAGFHEPEFVFRGFFPRKEGDRKKELELVRTSRVARVFAWFESPQRIVGALEFLAESCAERSEDDVHVVVAKELTKFHERFFAGRASDVSKQVSDEVAREGERGEWAFVIRWASSKDVENSQIAAENAGWDKALRCLLGARVSASEAARQVSQVFGVAKREAYDAALRLSGKKNGEGG